MLLSKIHNNKFISSSKSTARSSLYKHITKNDKIKIFQPININFRIIDSYNENSKVKGRKKALKSTKAIKDFKSRIKN